MSWPIIFFPALIFTAIPGAYNTSISIIPKEIIKPEYNKTIGAIPAPAGYKRIVAPENSFASWLRNIELKNNNTVYLYNGWPKKNQTAQFAVLNIPVGKKDLQQCADAVIRLRASYLFDNKRMKEIVFYDNNKKPYTYSGAGHMHDFEQYLEKVFACCGTASLEQQLKKKKHSMIEPGDVFIKGGSPGHAVIVTDMAVSNAGKKIFMLAQSYMPAQDMHILINPQNDMLSPWYTLEKGQLVTPEWIFQLTQLYGW